MLVNGPIFPVALELLAGDVVITPSSSVTPPAPNVWDEVSRTYDIATLSAHVGEPLRIRAGWGPGTIDDGTQTQSHLDLVTLDVENRLFPSPEYGATVLVGDVDLSWTNLDPCSPGGDVYVDVWFGTEPNITDPGYDMIKVVPAGENTITAQVNAPATGTYYWQVNSYRNGSPTGDPCESIVYAFNAVDDLAPTVVIDDDLVRSSGTVECDRY